MCVCGLMRRQGQTVTFSQQAFDTYHTGLVTAQLISMHNYSSISDIWLIMYTIFTGQSHTQICLRWKKRKSLVQGQRERSLVIHTVHTHLNINAFIHVHLNLYKYLMHIFRNHLAASSFYSKTIYIFGVFVNVSLFINTFS